MTEKELVAKMQETLVKSRKELANIDFRWVQMSENQNLEYKEA